jgi:group I intron endonuclease
MDDEVFNGEIYCVTNDKNGNQYVGQTMKGFEKRKHDHLYDARRGSNMVIHQAIRKHGVENFTWEILESGLANHTELDDMEKYWIRVLNTYHRGYNSDRGGSGSSGRITTKVTRQKIREATTGKKRSVEARQNISKSKLGAKNYNYGKSIPAEVKLKMSKRKLGANNPYYGKHHSPEAKQKISEANSGANSSNYGKKMSAETKQKIREARNIPVEQCDILTGKVIRTFKSATEAQFLLGISNANINCCCTGKRKSAGGFAWKYAPTVTEQLNLLHNNQESKSEEEILWETMSSIRQEGLR